MNITILNFRLVLDRHPGAMSGRHIAVETWLEALDMTQYLPAFQKYGGVEVSWLTLSAVDLRSLCDTILINKITALYMFATINNCIIYCYKLKVTESLLL